MKPSQKVLYKQGRSTNLLSWEKINAILWPKRWKQASRTFKIRKEALFLCGIITACKRNRIICWIMPQYTLPMTLIPHHFNSKGRLIKLMAWLLKRTNLSKTWKKSRKSNQSKLINENWSVCHFSLMKRANFYLITTSLKYCLATSRQVWQLWINRPNWKSASMNTMMLSRKSTQKELQKWWLEQMA